MSTPDAAAHLDAAIRALCLEAYGGANPCDLKPVAHFTIAEDLRRIDRAIGPTGESIFALIADSIDEAYVEILAARAALDRGPLPPTEVGERVGRAIRRLHQDLKAEHARQPTGWLGRPRQCHHEIMGGCRALKALHTELFGAEGA
jgi:hypothetical protein